MVVKTHGVDQNIKSHITHQKVETSTGYITITSVPIAECWVFPIITSIPIYFVYTYRLFICTVYITHF